MSRAPCRVAARESNCAQHRQQINLNHEWTRRYTNGIGLRPSSVARAFEISIEQQAALVSAAPCFGVERSVSRHDGAHDGARTFSPKCKAPAAGQTRNAQLQPPKRQLPSFVSIRGLNQVRGAPAQNPVAKPVLPAIPRSTFHPPCQIFSTPNKSKPPSKIFQNGNWKKLPSSASSSSTTSRRRLIS